MGRSRTIITVLALLWSSVAFAGWEDASPTAVWAHADSNGRADAWKWLCREQTIAEADDVTGDVRPDVFFVLSDGRFLRAEVDINQDGRAERIFLFDGAGNVTTYRDPDGDGVVYDVSMDYAPERDMNLEDARAQIILREAVRRRVAFMENPDSFAPMADILAPPHRPPFEKIPGDKVTVKIRAWRSPDTKPEINTRTDRPWRMDLLPFQCETARGTRLEALNVKVERDLLLNPKMGPSKADIVMEFYPFFRRVKNDRDEMENHLWIQLAGQVKTKDRFADYFSHMGELDKDSPLFVSSPGYDENGNPSGTLFFEIRLLDLQKHKAEKPPAEKPKNKKQKGKKH